VLVGVEISLSRSCGPCLQNAALTLNPSQRGPGRRCGCGAGPKLARAAAIGIAADLAAGGNGRQKAGEPSDAGEAGVSRLPRPLPTAPPPPKPASHELGVARPPGAAVATGGPEP